MEFAGQVARAIKGAILCGDFYGVVVVDRNEHFLGLFRTDRFLSLLAYPMDRYCIFVYQHCHDTIEPVTVLAETELGPILKNPDVRVQTVEATKHVVRGSCNRSRTSCEARNSRQASVLRRTRQILANSSACCRSTAIYDKVLSVLLEPR